MQISGQVYAAAVLLLVMSPWYTVNKVLFGPENLSGYLGEERFIAPPRGN